MKVLIACEFSGIVRDAFKALGHDAWSCDLLPTEKPGQHIQGDVRNVLDFGWDLMIAHPSCTYLANSGVQWLHRDPERWRKMYEAAQFFKLFWNAPIPHIAIENPIMHGYAKDAIGIEQAQVIQPWMFGEDASKGTCLWLKNMPKLQSTNLLIKKRYANQSPCGANNIPPSDTRWMERSRTYPGIADAMAKQWGNIDNLPMQYDLFKDAS